MLTCENISCIRGGHVIFDQLGFCLQEGALLLIKGANGVGKSSLIEILSGQLTPDRGQVLWDKKPIRNHPDLKREMLVIGHNSDIRDNATVEANISAWGKQYGTQTLVQAALSFYGLTLYKNMKAKHLSAGLRRRLALARLIVAPCKLWLLDEPTNFLDEDALLLTTSLIETRVKQGGIVIIATHIMNSSIDAHMLEIADFTPLNPKP